MRDPYDVLRLRRDATPDEVREAWLRLVKANHPDKCPGDAGATARVAEINAAHDILSDPDKRKALDDHMNGYGEGVPHGASEAADFLIAAAFNTIGKAREVVGDEPVSSFAARVGKGLVARAATAEGREQLAAAGAALEQGLSALFRP